ncbi:capsule biosynthesis protein [Rhodophyticola sp. CCM32]|nr:capsule biosynthesis protein [Rhodophyticola sp. CCM32]
MPISAAHPSRVRKRHWLVVLSFIIMVASPAAATAWYLWTRAADQYASFVGFSVRMEETGSAIEILGGITDLSGSSSSDTDILYEFLQSQELVRRVDDHLDLRRIWSRGDPAIDPVFAYHPPGAIEDLVAHWDRKVRIYYDNGSGLIDLRVLAYDPADAQRIAQLIFEESSAMINALSDVAQEDAISYARDELSQAENRLTAARVALTAFRNRTQIVDPTIDTQGQMGLVSTLQAQLAEALIELDVLRETTRENDPRIVQVERRVTVIENRIAQERAVLGTGANGDSAFADLVGEYERLAIDREFATQAYTAALAAFDAARNDARRQSRYLAAHVQPTLSETAQYPKRGLLFGMITVFAILIWSVVVLVGYSLRDRR